MKNLKKEFENRKTRITKINRLLSVRNEWVCNDYYMVHGRIYYSDTTYQKIKFVLIVDMCNDPYDYYYDDELSEEENMNRVYSKEDIKEMVNALATTTFESFECNTIEETIDWCNNTIEEYNRC